MNSAMFGYAIGIFLAAGGCGYLLIGLLRLIRVHKRWPRATYFIGCMFVLLVGLITAGNAITSIEVIVASVATLSAAAFVALYRSPFKQGPA